MTFAAWNRLVDLYERQILSLLSHGVPIAVRGAAFEEALNRVMRSIILGVAEVNAESWRAPAQKPSKARSNKKAEVIEFRQLFAVLRHRADRVLPQLHFQASLPDPQDLRAKL